MRFIYGSINSLKLVILFILTVIFRFTFFSWTFFKQKYIMVAKKKKKIVKIKKVTEVHNFMHRSLLSYHMKTVFLRIGKKENMLRNLVGMPTCVHKIRTHTGTYTLNMIGDEKKHNRAINCCVHFCLFGINL